MAALTLVTIVIFFSPVNFPMCVTLYFCQVANVVSSELDGAGPAKHVKVSGFVSDSSAASNKNSKSDRKPKHLKGTFFRYIRPEVLKLIGARCALGKTRPKFWQTFHKKSKRIKMLN